MRTNGKCVSDQGQAVVATRVPFGRDGGDVIKTRTADRPSNDEPVPDYGELRAEVGLSARDIAVSKYGWSAFYGTDLDLELWRRKITGSSSPASRPASASNERGYELTIVTDAITDTDERAHRNSLRAIFPRIAELVTTEEVLDAAIGSTRLMVT